MRWLLLRSLAIIAVGTLVGVAVGLAGKSPQAAAEASGPLAPLLARIDAIEDELDVLRPLHEALEAGEPVRCVWRMEPDPKHQAEQAWLLDTVSMHCSRVEPCLLSLERSLNPGGEAATP